MDPSGHYCQEYYQKQGYSETEAKKHAAADTAKENELRRKAQEKGINVSDDTIQKKVNKDSDARRAAERESAKKGSNGSNSNNILNKPVYEWSDEELQRAVDSVHNSVYGPNGKYYNKGGANPYSLIVTEENLVVLAKNNQNPSRANTKMNEIFGEGNYVIVSGTSTTHYKVPDGMVLTEEGYINHAEVRAIQGVKDNGGTVKNAREVCSHLSCESCTEIMKNEQIKQITPAVFPDSRGERGRYKRNYIGDLW